jgi:hypothetical protein
MMLATMLVQGQAEPRLVVPASAVVRENNADYVFVAEGRGVTACARSLWAMRRAASGSSMPA